MMSKNENNLKIKKLAICLALPLTVGSIAGMGISKDVKEYGELDKPSFAPPKWVFPIAWTTLYSLMGTAKYIALKNADNKQEKKIQMADGLQLGLNFIWSFLFFKFHLRGTALIEMTLLLFAILWTIYEYYQVSPKAGYLLLPYLVWVSFALTLNASVWKKNRNK